MADIKFPLNKTQLEILKLFSQPLSEEELQEIKALLVKHLAEKLSRKVDKISKKKGYTQKDFDNWLNDPGQ
jgi:arsenate reductase-like glutaredoxin family protein